MANNSSSQDWSKMSEHQVIVRLARIAQSDGWLAARDAAIENLEAEEVDDLLRGARKWADRRPTW